MFSPSVLVESVSWRVGRDNKIHSSEDARREFEIEQGLRRAFYALHAAPIRVRGGGRFMNGSAYIVLCAADGPAARAVLERVVYERRN
jgi:hypothetical protein